MSSKKKILPELRFPEFEKAEWERKLLGKFIKERNEISNGKYPLFSLTIENGVTPKTGRYERAFLVKDEKEAYKLAHPNDFAFNPMNLRFGAIAQFKGQIIVALSKYYNIFYCEDSVDSRFCEFYFKSNQMLAIYDDIATGSLIEKRRVHFSEFLKLKIPFPTPQEQQKIASCLSSLDELLAAHTEKLEALKDHKKGLMQNLFPQEGEKVPKYRFKEFENDGEWVEKKLGASVDFVMGNAFKSQDFVDYGVQLIRMGNLYQGELQLNRTPVYLPKSFETEYSRFLVRPKDLLMSMTGTMGKKDYGFVIEIPEGSPILLLNQRVLKIIPKKTSLKGFVLQQLKNDFFLDMLYSIPGGTKQANLSTKDLREIKVFFPSIEEQQKIASCLSAVDELITAQTEKIKQLQQHKKGLMQGLFPKIAE